jgi:hypothetical protein
VRRIACFVLVVVIAACGGGDDATDDAVVDRTRPVPANVRAFLDRIADPTSIAFTADYALLNKNGGGQHTIHVESEPPTLTVAIDGARVDLDDEPKLASFGIFSGFLAKNPAAAIEATARRADAGAARFSTQTAASDALRCVEIPVQRAVTSRWCLTDEGIFGFVDNPSVRYELTSYRVS